MRPNRLAPVPVLVTAALLTGCGGSGSSPSAKQECVLRARADARAAVIIQAFRQGKLGTRQDVEHAVAPRPSFFDKRGRIIPYDRQGPQQQLAFDAWANTQRVHDITGPAQDAALARLKPDC